MNFVLCPVRNNIYFTRKAIIDTTGFPAHGGGG